MTGIFANLGIDIQALVGANIGPSMLDATLHTYQWGDRDESDPGAGREKIETNVACKGFTADYDDEDMDRTLVEDGDRMVVLIGSTLSGAVPKTGFQVTIEGVRYNIVRVQRDPAAATFTCQVRST